MEDCGERDEFAVPKRVRVGLVVVLEVEVEVSMVRLVGEVYVGMDDFEVVDWAVDGWIPDLDDDDGDVSEEVILVFMYPASLLAPDAPTVATETIVDFNPEDHEEVDEEGAWCDVVV